MSLEEKIEALAAAVKENTLQMVTLTKYMKQVSGAAPTEDAAKTEKVKSKSKNNAETPLETDGELEIPPALDRREKTVVKGAAKAASVSLDDIRAAFLELTQKKGKDVALGVIADFGATRASEIPEREWPKAVEAAKAKSAE